METGRPAAAVRLSAAAETLLSAGGSHLNAVDRAVYDRQVAAARRQLDAGTFAALYAAGAALPLAAVLAEAAAFGDAKAGPVAPGAGPAP